jgi:leucyl-tRNA synthetase
MLQWSMRISAYAERLLTGLDKIDWPEPLKEMQRNWIGKSKGAQLEFNIQDSEFKIEVFTTRIDTIFGATFLVLAPEHELVDQITTDEQRSAVSDYVQVAKNRSERERMTEVKRVSGAFTGAYAINPFNNERIPIWISDYVLAGYGTGAVMAVPGHDERDHRFAKHFNLPIVQVVDGPSVEEEAFVSWDAKIINSGFMNGLTVDDAIEAGIKFVEEKGIGNGKVNYRMRDAIFGRQRYWGEPFPVYFKDGIPKLVEEKDLPVTLPEIDEYKPTETGEPPLARAKNWGYRPHPNPSPGERGYETSEKNYWHLLKEFSKENRKNQTEAETIIWNKVRDSKLGHKVRRQHAIGVFIADFVCLDKRLVIEIDGDYHNQTKEYDQARTEFLNSEGFSVIRFTNTEVFNNLQSVISSIKTSLDNAPSIARTSPSPTEKGQGDEAYPFELTTMPGWAGSSWYWFRYMDPKNETAFADKKEIDYWQDVDLYMGGSEHATGHLLYSRFWCKALKDLGYVSAEEPFKKLINQGMILGYTNELYRHPQKKLIWSEDELEKLFIDDSFPNDRDRLPMPWETESTSKEIVERFESYGIQSRKEFSRVLVYPEFVNQNNELIISDKFFSHPEYEEFKDYTIVPNFKGKLVLGRVLDKMSKSKKNVVNPDDIIDNYGADTLRLYEMFLGPLELSKPWNTNGIDGVFKFLRKFWNLYHDAQGNWNVSDGEPTRDELKILHKTIKKVEQDINNFSFNTTVSEFMICVNELSAIKCNKRAVLEPLAIILSPYAPHLAEELWEKLGHSDTILKAQFPNWNEEYLKESSFEYPISINGKVRTKMEFALDMPKEDIEKVVLASELVNKWTEGKPPKKVIVVPGKIVNVVI